MRPARRFHLPTVLITIVFLITCVSAHAQPQSSLALDPSNYRPIPIIKLNLKGVKDFGEVTPNLYRGAHASPEGLRSLKEMGIQIVIDLRGRKHRDEGRVEQLGMEYVHIGGTCFSTER